MNIKEIALKVADSLRNKVDGISHMQSNQGLVAFAEALVAELAKQNEHIGAIQNGKFRWSIDGGPEKWRARKEFIGKLYTFPPTAEQIANETAEACAAYLTSGRYMVLNPGVLISAEIHTQYIKNHDIYQANAIRRGAWKEFKNV